MKAFVIFRDRVTYGRPCVAALQAAGLDVIIADHGTTWPEAVDWLHDLQGQGVTVVRSGGGHPRDLWNRDLFRALCGNDRYVVTDPDVIPSDDCPTDWLQHLEAILDEHPGCRKAGLGLRLDRIPDHYPRRSQVLEWEQQFWAHPVADDLYDAQIDTTLALHAPLAAGEGHSFTALRTGAPYLADHLAWYEDHDNLPGDLKHYHEHAEAGITFWTVAGRSAWAEAGRGEWR